MTIDNEALRREIMDNAGVELSEASLARVRGARAGAAKALRGVAAGSLFDTEPEHLHAVLEALAGNEPR